MTTLRAFSVSLFVLFGLSAGSSAHADALLARPLKTVMITAFRWSDPLSLNGSPAAARALAVRLKAKGINAKICIVPVIWDEAARLALVCYARMNPKPDLVMSLGENPALYPGQIQASLAAANLDSAGPDDANETRDDQVIDPALPQKIEFSLPVERLQNSEMARRDHLQFNPDSAGPFVCNNSAFHLIAKLKPRGVTYLFVHIPTLDNGGYALEGVLPSLHNAEVSGDWLSRLVDLLDVAKIRNSAGVHRVRTAVVLRRQLPTGRKNIATHRLP